MSLLKDPSLAEQGLLKIEFAGSRMPVLRLIREDFERRRPLEGVRIAGCLHVTTETANLCRVLVAGGARLRTFSRPILEAALKASNELYAELAQRSAHFKRIYAGWSRFRNDQFLWFRVAEAGYDNFVFSSPAPSGKK